MTIVTIDGPAGAGKSTIARRMALKLGFLYLDTGAMYRAVAWAARQAGIDVRDEQSVLALCNGIRIGFSDGRVTVNGRDVSSEIRTPEMDALSSSVSRIPGVRGFLVDAQREIAKGRDVIVEGRDMGTVVFPDADHKFYLTAAVDVRAARRKIQLDASGEQVPFEEVLSRMKSRDEADSSRKVAPLKPAVDAVVIDSTDFGVEEVIHQILVAMGHHRAMGEAQD